MQRCEGWGLWGAVVGGAAAAALLSTAPNCSRGAAETKVAALRALRGAALLPAASVSLLPTAPNCPPQRLGRLEALPPYAIVEMALYDRVNYY